MTDEHHRVTRRAVIRSTVVAAGLVWTAPAIPTVKPLDPTGTPPPTSSSSTTPTSTTYTFGGPIQIAVRASAPQTGCELSADTEYQTSVVGIGLATVTEHYCVNRAPGNQFGVIGPFTLSVSGGSLLGTVDGIYAFQFPPFPFHSDITITSGTGIFAGAVGSAVVDGNGNNNFPSVITGEIAGTFDVPA